MLEGEHRVLLYMLKTVEGELNLLEAVKLLEVLEVIDVMRGVPCILEAVESRLSLLEALEMLEVLVMLEVMRGIQFKLISYFRNNVKDQRHKLCDRNVRLDYPREFRTFHRKLDDQLLTMDVTKFALGCNIRLGHTLLAECNAEETPLPRQSPRG
jgi:hypothetical protein